MNYIQYTFTVSPPEPGSDILIALLADFGFESFSSSDTGFEAYIQEEFDNEADLKTLDFDDFTFSFVRTVIPKTNWNEEWEKNFNPVYVDDLVCIRAGFHPKSAAAKHDIIITPKMSFGTGHHDTTWLVSKTMFELDFTNTSVLDMGCGTGILAILAKQLGASAVLGIDIDDWSIENSIENAEINNASDIVFQKGDAALLPATESFDIILANINKNVLKKDMASYFRALKKNGTLLLSGFFGTDVEELKELAISLGFAFEKSYTKNEWAVMKLKKIAKAKLMQTAFHEIQRFNKWWHYLIIGSPFILGIIVGMAMYADIKQKISVSEPSPLLIVGATILGTFLLFLWFLYLKLETRIDAQGIYVRFHGIPFCKRHIAWQDIKTISLISYSPLSDYGGWGVRYGMAGNGWCYNVSGSNGIKLFYQNGKPFLIGTQQAEAARQTIEHYFKS